MLRKTIESVRNRNINKAEVPIRDRKLSGLVCATEVETVLRGANVIDGACRPWDTPHGHAGSDVGHRENFIEGLTTDLTRL